MFQYLDAKCHLWNVYFKGTVTNLRDCEPLESFETIDRRLFFALVCYPLGISRIYNAARARPAGIIVTPKLSEPEITVMVQDPRPGPNRYWNRPEVVNASGLSFSFIDFFQWNLYEFLSMPTVRCKIATCSQHPEYVGREALIDNNLVEFFLAAAQESAENGSND